MLRSFSDSSLWKLTGMTLGIVGSAMLMMWLVTSWALRRSFDDVGRAIILDDLGEYGELYARGGVDAVSGLFFAGGHDEHNQILRLVSPAGEIQLDVLIPGQPAIHWPDFSDVPHPRDGEILWRRERLANGINLTVGRRRLEDGAELWFGRTNRSDLAAIRSVQEWNFLALLFTGVLAVGPVLWFANRVLRPVHDLMEGARRMARDRSLDHRLATTAAIPELEQFAEAFNASLDRIRALTEELEAANDQLAHELRTPLARIRGNIERILKQTDGGNQEDAVRAIEEIDRASELIQRILSIRAGDSGAMKLQRSPLSPCELVREIHDLYSPSAEERSLAFPLRLPDDDRLVPLDRQRFHQALCNLLDNAFAYTPAGGEVELSLEFTDHDHVRFLVRDTGPGLKAGDERRIWRRFMRGSAASAQTPGIGLGLSLVRAVATAHGGEADARNRPEGGAEFWIRLPFD